jgi:GntR family transcriptional regulator/MocR family aminotransferase
VRVSNALVDVVEQARVDDGRPMYERLARSIEAAIRDGRLSDGERLPTVRSLATQASVSVSTVAAAYNLLAETSLIEGQTGRGTFVTTVHLATSNGVKPGQRAWRRSMLAQTEFHLRQRHPTATDLTRGGPDLSLLPLDALRNAIHEVADEFTPHDLGYPLKMETDGELRRAVVNRLDADGIKASPDHVVTMSSAQQFLSSVAAMLANRATPPSVAVVEEPGYQTALDTLERNGWDLVGVGLDEHGVIPDELDRRLSENPATLVILTPRAQSPTGATWTEERRLQLADVLRRHPNVVVVEDDHFAEACTTSPGSLINHDDLGARTIYVRSASKTIAPDLRIAVGIAPTLLLNRLWLEKSFADGWTSRMSQRVLAALLRSDDVAHQTRHAAETYRARRRAAFEVLDRSPNFAGRITLPPEGLNLWLVLPEQLVADAAVEAIGANGVLVTAGAPFFVRPGDTQHLRVNAGALDVSDTTDAAKRIVHAIDSLVNQPNTMLSP